MHGALVESGVEDVYRTKGLVGIGPIAKYGVSCSDTDEPAPSMRSTLVKRTIDDERRCCSLM